MAYSGTVKNTTKLDLLSMIETLNSVNPFVALLDLEEWNP